MSLRLSVITNAPWTSTGYASQAKALLPRLQAPAGGGHAVSIQANWGLHGGLVNWNGMPVYPRVFDKYGRDSAIAHARHFGADLVLSFCDLPLLAPENMKALPTAPYFPVDHDPLPAVIRDRAKLAFAPLVYSRFAERVCREAGLQNVRYLSHPVDCATYSPGNRLAACQATGLPQDRYIVGMVAMNKYTRKRFDVHLQAFRLFQQKHPDALLYLHTYAGEEMGGVDLWALCAACGLEPGRDVFFPPQYPMAAGLISDAEMAQLYRAMDVLLLVSEGEGFGIPIVEAQACGTPVVVGGWTSMPELCFGGAIVDPAAATRVWDGKFDSWHWLARPEAVADALDQLLRRDLCEHLAVTARAGALTYDADTVVREEWAPLLAELEERLRAERPAPVMAPGTPEPVEALA